MAAAVFWLFTAYHSPINPWLLRRLAAHHRRTRSGLEWSCRRAGWAGLFSQIRLRHVHLRLAGSDSVDIREVEIRIRRRPLLARRLSIRSIRIDEVRFESTLEPAAAWPVPALQGAFDTARMPDITIQPVNGRIHVPDPEAAGPTLIEIAGGRIHAALSSPSARKTSYAFDLRAELAVNGHAPAPLSIRGWVNPRLPDPDKLDLDLDLTLDALPMPSLTARHTRRIPFIADRGTLAMLVNLRAREGRLSGLASLRIRDLIVRENPDAVNAHFLTLSFHAWQFLARQRNGHIDADAQIQGTVHAPLIPIGHVLQQQAGHIGRNVAVRLLDTLPGPGTDRQAKRLEASRDSAGRHDDILKIARLPEHERHYERGRHYERIVKGYATAAEEYRRQADRFPAQTNLAVLALMASARVHARRLDQPDQARTDLRRVLDTYPGHPDADDALFEMIRIAEDRRDFPVADRLCREFLERFPRSEFTPKIQAIRTRIRPFVW